MVRRLYASPALYATLGLFFRYPFDPLYPRLIVRYTGIDIKGVLRELKRLEQIGIIRTRGAGRLREYELNEDFPLHVELTALFDKMRERPDGTVQPSPLTGVESGEE
jgi:hypothetical protein